MVTTKAYGSVRRFGPRYGKRIKDRIGKIEALAAESKLCPYCKKEGIKRMAAGIWCCKKCKSKFTGGAYTIGALKLEEETKAEETPEKTKTAKKTRKEVEE